LVDKSIDLPVVVFCLIYPPPPFADCLYIRRTIEGAKLVFVGARLFEESIPINHWKFTQFPIAKKIMLAKENRASNRVLGIERKLARNLFRDCICFVSVDVPPP